MIVAVFVAESGCDMAVPYLRSYYSMQSEGTHSHIRARMNEWREGEHLGSSFSAFYSNHASPPGHGYAIASRPAARTAVRLLSKTKAELIASPRPCDGPPKLSIAVARRRLHRSFSRTNRVLLP